MSTTPYIDLRAIAHQTMATYGFTPSFPPNVIREVQAMTSRLNDGSPRPHARDLRELLWSSIDNSDSLDLDQIEFCQRASNREIRVLVAIADVDEYVGKGALADRHAGHNGTSVYTGVEIFPMLPERLSNDLSSLNPNEDRLAVVIEFFVLKDGNIRPGEVYRGLVHNHAKLIYEEVGEWLEGTRDVPPGVARVAGLEEQLRLQDEAAQRLNSFRMEKGALELETIEPRAVMSEGRVRDLVVVHKNRARFLIENFMVAANGTMVDFLSRHGQPHIQRVVREPDRWPRIRDIAYTYNETLPVEPDPRALADFLARRRKADPERFPDLSLTIVKLLGAGEYVMIEPGRGKAGHFGLAVQDYTHSTAPNRRYVDVIIQRLIKAVLARESQPYNKGELNDIANRCSERDKASKKVERFMRKVAAAVLLSGRQGETFDAIVTGASEKGTYVRLLHPPAEGRVIHGEIGMDVGEKVRVRLVNLDPENGYIDFERAGTMMHGIKFNPALVGRRPSPRRK